MFPGRHLTRTSYRLIAFRRNISLSSGIGSVDRAVANQLIQAYDTDEAPSYVKSLNLNPMEASTWKWDSGLGLKPTYTTEELRECIMKAKDPFQLVEGDVSTLSGGIKDLLGSDHPVLESCAKYFFDMDGGKKIRPVMVLAVSYALNMQLNSPVKDILIAQNQRRLAEITEMIHTASLFHDDVIDKATTRRGVPSVNQVFGNKLAILGGDFLLSRASVALARLKNLEVVELLSTVIEHLVKGEVMQMKPYSFNFDSENGESISKKALEYYLRKNFYKTASLMGNSCLATAILGGHNLDNQKASYLYGTYVGQAFQLIDDALDFEGSLQAIGKAPLADLKSGLATAPILFAAEEYPKLVTLIGRKFEAPGDVDEAVSLVAKSQGINKTKLLAQVHCEKAIEAILTLEPSDARDSLVSLACKVITRSH